MLEFGSRRMLPTFPPKSRTFLPRQFASPSCCAKYVNCPVFVERKATDPQSVSQIKELAVEIIRTITVVVKGDVQHDNEHAFVNSNVSFRRHVIEFERRQQRDAAL